MLSNYNLLFLVCLDSGFQNSSNDNLPKCLKKVERKVVRYSLSGPYLTFSIALLPTFPNTDGRCHGNQETMRAGVGTSRATRNAGLFSLSPRRPRSLFSLTSLLALIRASD